MGCNCGRGQRNTTRGRGTVGPRGVSAPRLVTPRPAQGLAALNAQQKKDQSDRLDAAKRKRERIKRDAVRKKLGR